MVNKNILEVCLSPDLGGLELYMQNCSRELSKEFNVLCTISNKSKLKPFLDDLKVVEIKRKTGFSFFSSRNLARIIDENKIDLIHIHWTKDIPIVVFAKLLSKRKPKIVQTRHMTMTRFKNDFYHKFLYKNIDMIICVTKALGNQINKFIPENIRPEVKVLYLGAKNVKEFAEDELKVYKEELNTENSFIVGFVGRINEAKGQYLLIEALKRLKIKNLDIKVAYLHSEIKSLDVKYTNGIYTLRAKEQIDNTGDESITFKTVIVEYLKAKSYIKGDKAFKDKEDNVTLSGNVFGENKENGWTVKGQEIVYYKELDRFNSSKPVEAYNTKKKLKSHSPNTTTLFS